MKSVHLYTIPTAYKWQATLEVFKIENINPLTKSSCSNITKGTVLVPYQANGWEVRVMSIYTTDAITVITQNY